MRDFTMVPSALWRSPKFWRLPSDSERLAFMYLLTSPHQNSAGCYALPIGYAAADLRWSPDQVSAAMMTMAKAELIDIEADPCEIMIVDWFQSCPPANSKHFLGTKALIDRLDSIRLKTAAHEALDAAWAGAEGRIAQRALSKTNSPAQRSLSLLASLKGGKS